MFLIGAQVRNTKITELKGQRKCWTIRKITDEEISHFDKIYDGLDFGYAVDPSAYVQCYFDKARKKLYIFIIYIRFKTGKNRDIIKLRYPIL